MLNSKKMLNSKLSSKKSSKVWVRCPNCGHKFFSVSQQDGLNTELEIKCSSCKAIVKVKLTNRDGVFQTVTGIVQSKSR